MGNEVALPEWADPGDKVVTGELVGSIEPVKWANFIGLISEGELVAEAARRAGITRYQVNGAVRTDSKAREQYEEAKIAAVWRNWDVETIEEVLTALMMCEENGHLNKILDNRGLDSASFYRLMQRDPMVKETYEEARQIQAEVMADEMQAIADDGLNDTYTDDKGNRRVDQDVFQRSRLRVDTMKWRMSKLHWKRFGDKQQHQIDANVTVDHAHRLEAGRKRLEDLHRSRGGGG